MDFLAPILRLKQEAVVRRVAQISLRNGLGKGHDQLKGFGCELGFARYGIDLIYYAIPNADTIVKSQNNGFRLAALDDHAADVVHSVGRIVQVVGVVAKCIFPARTLMHKGDPDLRRIALADITLPAARKIGGIVSGYHITLWQGRSCLSGQANPAI